MGITTKSRLEKSINSLLGIIEGLSIDGLVNEAEKSFLDVWLAEHHSLESRHPYNELIPVVRAAFEDGILTADEKENITWLCEKLTSREFFDARTADLQRLHAIVGGIAIDGVVTEAEIQGLSDWLEEHSHLKTCWPYDEIDSLVTAVMADRKISPTEHELLTRFFGEFVAVLDERTVVNPRVEEAGTVVGLCAVCPEITFKGSRFVFTGKSSRLTRDQFVDEVRKRGGEVARSVSSLTQYLVIGAEGNPCWAYACYGRKVEQAVELRKEGVPILIVHENDFHDAVAEAA